MKPEIQINAGTLFAATLNHIHRDPLSNGEIEEVVEIVNNLLHTINATSQDFGGLKPKHLSCAYGGLLGECAIGLYKTAIDEMPEMDTDLRQAAFNESMAITLGRAIEGVALAMIQEGI